MSEPIFLGCTTPEQDNRLLESIRKAQEGIERHHRCHGEGQTANDNNRRAYRTRKGSIINNPYEFGSDDWKSWNEGYQYRDMVNDG